MLFNPRIRNLILLYLSAISVFVGIMNNFFLILRGGLFLFLASEWVENKCNSSLFFLTSGPLLNASETSVLKAHECQKRHNLHTNELNTTFFCSTGPLKDPNRLKSFKLAWRFVLTSFDIYQKPFIQDKILKFW
jgi:hypothetical protein